MAKNDSILLDGILAERATLESLDKGELFELFAFEQILKSYDLTRAELEHGWVDGKDDGGIDGYYTFVNGALVTDLNNFHWPRKGVNIDVVIINCKHKDSFQQQPLNTLFPTLEELLDFEKSPSDFDGKYSNALIRARENTIQAFRRTASTLPKLNFRVVYATRGDTVESNVEARGQQLKRIVSDYFSEANVDLDFLGATELVALHRKNRYVLQLPYSEQLSGERGAYIMLVRLTAYNKFVRDEKGYLRRYLFDSNVRDFLGENRVNHDIFSSLEDLESPEFWWLNNGITILATSATPLGKTEEGNALQLHDVQIVNGLQTTQTIHNYFQSEKASKCDTRCVLVKVIVSDESAIRDKIIRATNNQSSVELASLTATDKIQRDIEAILEQHNWFYERRKNYYKNIGKPVDRFVQPLSLAASVIALVRKSPQVAGRLQSRFMSDSVSYSSVFSEKLPITIWPKLVDIMKIIDKVISTKSPKNKTGRRMISAHRGATALCTIAEYFGTFNFSIEDLLGLDISKISEDRIGEILRYFRTTTVDRPISTDGNSTRIKSPIEILCLQFGNTYKIKETEVIGRWTLPSSHSSVKAKTGASSPNMQKNFAHTREPIDDAKIQLVKSTLPPQPWKPGTQQVVAEKTGLSLNEVRRCIKELVASGEFNNQIDGVVFNKSGIIVCVDIERANRIYQVGERFVRP